MPDLNPNIIPVNVVGSNTGGMETKIVETPGGQKDFAVTFIPVIYALGARFASVFFNTLAGTTVLNGFGYIDIDLATTGLKIAGSAATMALVISLGTLSSSLEKKYPILSQFT